MLQQLQSTGLRGAAPASVLLRATLPALRQWRAYGFGAHVSDNDPQMLEKEKNRQLKGRTVSHIKQVPGWSERLASDAEAVVKAEHECPDCPIEEMQRQTVETLQEEADADAASDAEEPRSGSVGGSGA